LVVTLTQHFERKKQITEEGKIKQPQKNLFIGKIGKIQFLSDQTSPYLQKVKE